MHDLRATLIRIGTARVPAYRRLMHENLCLNAMRPQCGENRFVRVPAVERRIEIPADVRRGRRWNTSDEVTIGRTTYDHACLPVARQHHAESTRVEVEIIHVGETSERMPGDHELEGQALQLIRGIDHDIVKPCRVKGNAKQPLLFVVADRNSNVLLLH